MANAKGEYKIVLLGEGRVGKTSIISRFTKDTFDEEESSTTQATMYSVKSVPIGGYSVGTSSSSAASPSSQRTVRLAIWDTAGQERFHALAPIYYRSAAGAILVYDVCDAESLRRVKTWVRELRTVTGDSIRLLVCGNKCDRPAGEQEVSPAESQAVAAEFNAVHYFTSAKTGMGVAEAFGAMATMVYDNTVINSDCALAGKTPGGGMDAGAYDTLGRRRRRRVISAEGIDGVAGNNLFLDDGDAGLGMEIGGGMRTSADYDSTLRPPRAGRPLTLADMTCPEEDGSPGHAIGDGGAAHSSGCC